jgi:hypothetical protein
MGISDSSLDNGIWFLVSDQPGLESPRGMCRASRWGPAMECKGQGCSGRARCLAFGVPFPEDSTITHTKPG